MFTWISIYNEIARRVLDFEENQAGLLDLLHRLGEEGLPVISISDRAEGDVTIKLQEIDPFTFFSNFNRGTTSENRRRFLEALKRQWDLESPVPTDFDGLPVVNNMKSWFFPYAKNRNEDDVPKLWRLARESMERTPKTFERQVLDACLPIEQVSLPKLTMGMFWLNPTTYFAVDQKNVSFAAQRGIRLSANTADGYFQFLEDVTRNLGTDYVALSHQAHIESQQHKDKPPNSRPTGGVRFWALSAGEEGRQWQDFLDNGIIAIAWDNLGDLRRFKDRDEIRARLLELEPEEQGSRKNDIRACWEFAHEMKAGDIVFAKQGGANLLGVGRVTGDYSFNPERLSFRHVRSVEWISEDGPWDLPRDNRVAVKALTEVTEFKEFLERVSELTGVELPIPIGKPTPLSKPGLPEVSTRRYWWLNANPKIWNFEAKAVGETQTYTSHNERGNKRQKYKYFGEVKPGDLVIGYVTSPQKEIIAVCEITKGLHQAEGAERIEFKKVEQLQNPVLYEELKSNVALARSEPLINNQGSLFALSEEEYDIIRAAIDEKNPITVPAPLAAYTKREALSELFFSEQEIDDVLARLRRKKNLILQGPPGVGKTFIARRLAYLMMGVDDRSRVQMVQFHQSYAYEDFIQGYRPNDEGRFTIKPGIFYEFCRKAQRDPDNDYFFIIDEINRGNLSKIFGELMMLIEHDKRGQDFAIPLTYAKSSDDLFYIPENLHLIGMMNTADRSLSLVDYALRRRFAFATLRPKFASEKFAETLAGAGAPLALIEKIRDRMGAVNKVITDDERNLGPGYQIGHSYFCPGTDHRPLDEMWYREVIESEIKPLLEEYWVDEGGKVEEHVSRLLA